MELTPIEARILGALIEKESTTPDVYPLSLNALTTACNQSTNRDPVMELSDDTVRWAINNLRQQSFVRAIQPSDSRVMKYQHLVREKLHVDGAALAVLCVLLLRGAQTIGEIKTRTSRFVEFASLGDVEATVSDLVARGIAAEVPRRAGQKEIRYTHLLAGPLAAVEEGEAARAPRAPRESAAAGGAPATSNDERVAALESAVSDLRRELSELRAELEAFKRQF